MSLVGNTVKTFGQISGGEIISNCYIQESFVLRNVSHANEPLLAISINNNVQ